MGSEMCIRDSCHISHWGYESLHGYSLVGGPVPENSGGSGWLTLLLPPWGCKPPQLLQSLLQLLYQGLCAQSNGWLLASAPIFVSQEKAISGSCQQALPSIHNSIQVWRLYMGWILRWGSLWMAFLLVSAPHFVPIFSPVSILFPF